MNRPHGRLMVTGYQVDLVGPAEVNNRSGVWTPVDNVTDRPNAVKRQVRQHRVELPQLLDAAVDVPDDGDSLNSHVVIVS